MTIVKRYETMKQAERFQNRLYAIYDYVLLKNWPRWQESGVYVWEVK